VCLSWLTAPVVLSLPQPHRGDGTTWAGSITCCRGAWELPRTHPAEIGDLKYCCPKPVGASCAVLRSNWAAVSGAAAASHCCWSSAKHSTTTHLAQDAPRPPPQAAPPYACLCGDCNTCSTGPICLVVCSSSTNSHSNWQNVMTRPEY
jgi:hypothetical protein